MVRQLSDRRWVSPPVRLAYLFSVFQSVAPGLADWSRVGVLVNGQQ